jgi:hypothetical protein
MLKSAPITPTLGMLCCFVDREYQHRPNLLTQGSMRHKVSMMVVCFVGIALGTIIKAVRQIVYPALLKVSTRPTLEGNCCRPYQFGCCCAASGSAGQHQSVLQLFSHACDKHRNSTSAASDVRQMPALQLQAVKQYRCIQYVLHTGQAATGPTVQLHVVMIRMIHMRALKGAGTHQQCCLRLKRNTSACMSGVQQLVRRHRCCQHKGRQCC